MKGHQMTASNGNTGQSKVAPEFTEFSVTPAGEVTEVTPTDYNRKVDVTSHTTEHHHGHRVDFTTDTDTDVEMSGEFDDRVKAIVDGRVRDVMAEREKRENIRANHRNLNRMLTLFGALAIGLVLTFLFQNNGLPHVFSFPTWFAKDYEPYTFVITIAMDSGLALYGLIRHY